MPRHCFLTIIIYLIFIVPGCTADGDAERQQLNEKNTALQSQIDSLQSEIAELKRSPGELLQEVREQVRTHDLSAARQTFQLLRSRQFNAKQIKEINNLFLAINKADRADKQFAKNRSEDELIATATIKKQHVNHVYNKQVKHYAVHMERVGALCCDGSRSYATGRGACSHHGGVCQWLYQ